MTAHSVLNVRAAPEWGNSELYKYYERNGLGYGTIHCMNLTSWASLIQDVAQGMKVVPPNLSMEVFLEAMVLLQVLEATTGMGYCRICSQPSPRCHCEDDQYAPMVTWSQMMARMQGQGVAASIVGPTLPGATTAGVQE